MLISQATYLAMDRTLTTNGTYGSIKYALRRVLHITILVQFITHTHTIKDNLLELINAMSIVFLTTIGLSVIYGYVWSD